ncbi:MAG TPA: TRAP transporter large permease [Candidatus Udaeobacter sp.]|nr:TRAP transporter large permease [Candidatus Udaeobacter sp.]
MSLAAAIMLISFFVWGAVGMPIGFAMLASAFVYLLLKGQDLGLVASQSLNGLFRSFVLLAVPLFIVAAEIMNAGTVSERLIKFASLIVGRIRGGLAHVTVVASMIFSGMSGSAIADAAGPGKLMIEMMRKDGRYTPGFAGALAASAATIGPIIPPSIPMVLYAMVANTSVGYLFLGGFLPGTLMGISLMIVIAMVARRQNLPVEPPVRLREVPGIMRDSFPAVMLPVILLGGIYSGVVTPTEAAAVAAAYALLLACGLYRALSFGGVVHIFVNAARSTAIVALVVAGALLINYVVAAEQIPNEIGAWVQSLHVSKLGFLLIINLMFLILGCFLDTLLMLLVIVPIAMPTIRALGIDSVHFGVTTIVNLMIGMLTPPYSELLFVVTGVTGIRLTEMYGYVWPFIVALILALLAMLVVPQIVLWLPEQLGYIPGS